MLRDARSAGSMKPRCGADFYLKSPQWADRGLHAEVATVTLKGRYLRRAQLIDASHCAKPNFLPLLSLQTKPQGLQPQPPTALVANLSQISPRSAKPENKLTY